MAAFSLLSFAHSATFVQISGRIMVSSISLSLVSSSSMQASDNKLSWQQQKEEQARQRKRENELKKVEARIEELETRERLDEIL